MRNYWEHGIQELLGTIIHELLGTIIHELLGTRDGGTAGNLRYRNYWKPEIQELLGTQDT